MALFKHSPLFRLFAISSVAMAATFTVLSWFLWASFTDIKASTHRIFKIEHLKSSVIYYDEVLTMSAKMSAATGDIKWERRYRVYEPKLDNVFSELIKISPDVFTIAAATKTKKANTALVEKENAAFALVERGESNSALGILNSEEYKQQKRIYHESIESVETHLKKEAQKLQNRENTQLVISYIAMALAAAIFISLYIIIFKSTTEHFTEQKKYQQTIKKNKDFLNTILENIPNMISAKDAKELKFVLFNRAGEKLLGYTREEIIGKSAHEIFNKKEAALSTQDDKKALTSKTLIEVPSESIHTKDKKQIQLHTKKIPILNAQNDPEYLLGISEDITQKTRAEKEKEQLGKQLQKAQKMEAIGLMAGGVAHDLNNILAGIVSYPELLLLELPQSSKLRRPIEAILQSGLRAAAVVSDLLTVARGVASVKQILDLHTIIEEYLESPELKGLSTAYPGITIRKELDAHAPYILCSPIHIKKILMNLVTNSAEAIEYTGEIAIITSNIHIDKSPIDHPGLKSGHYVLLGVKDNGPGISKKDLPHIFEPFYTKKFMHKSGTGLGLAVVWNSVQDHSGSIFVESDNMGTCFKIYLPQKAKKVAIPPDDLEPDVLEGNGERILVIDDEPMLRDIACKILSTLGYDASSVSSGEAAIETVKTKAYDLLVIDMLMEPGINGYQTYQAIKKLHPKQKAIIASGFSENDNVKSSIDLGADQFIKKPYSLKALGLAVKEALSRSNATH